MGDHRFETFARRHQLLLRGLARKLCGQGGPDPEDLVQETFERALRHFDLLAPQAEGAQRAWLCTALHNRFLDLCRRRRTEALEQPELRLLRSQQELAPEEQAREKWERITEHDFRAAIGQLKPNLREAYELHAAGLKYRAIAQKLGVPEGTVGSWLFQARKDLNELLTPLARD
ncbi:RNA polymerase sigma factor [Myxococcaceae bacterium GXIMD 01537]